MPTIVPRSGRRMRAGWQIARAFRADLRGDSPAGDTVMLVGPESDQYALLTGRITDVRILREFTHSDEDYP